MVLGTSPIHYSIVSNGRGDMPFYFELKKILNKKNFVMFVMPIKYILYLRFIQYLIVRIYYLVFIEVRVRTRTLSILLEISKKQINFLTKIFEKNEQ